jgi:hypothetical protein
MYNFYFSGHQQQPGDPEKLAKALMTAVNDSNPPLRLIAGKGLVDYINQYLQGRRSGYEAWREVSDNTNFD